MKRMISGLLAALLLFPVICGAGTWTPVGGGVSGANSRTFDYINNCFVFELVGHGGVKHIGAGKIDAGNNFTGLIGLFDGSGGGYNGGGQVVSMLTGSGFAGVSTNGIGNPKWCGSDTACTWGFTQGPNFYLVATFNLPTVNLQKCYP